MNVTNSKRVQHRSVLTFAISMFCRRDLIRDPLRALRLSRGVLLPTSMLTMQSFQATRVSTAQEAVRYVQLVNTQLLPITKNTCQTGPEYLEASHNLHKICRRIRPLYQRASEPFLPISSNSVRLEIPHLQYLPSSSWYPQQCLRPQAIPTQPLRGTTNPEL